MITAGATGSGPSPLPTRAPGVILAGPMSGTGYRNPQWLIQRGDRYLQVSELLYRVAQLCDGEHRPDEIAVLVSAATRRGLSAEDVVALLETKLKPAGIVGDGSAPAPEKRRASALGVQLGTKVIGPRAIAPFAWLARVFYFPGVAIVALLASIATRFWLYGEHGLARPVEQVVLEPWRMAALAAIAVAAAAFHELGHATALTVAGGRPRGMGFGFYLIYPVLYTDVTDSYRLGRWGRLLTDVGGFYFNLIFALGAFAAYVVTREDWILVAIAVVDLEILHQLVPLGRLDGYWILADLTGVPDFFTMAGPFARRSTAGATRLPALKPVASAAVALYLILFVPAFALLTYVIARGAPHVATTALGSFLVQADRFEEARAAQDIWLGLASVGQGMLLLLPLLGIALFLLAVARWILGAFAKAAGRTHGQRIATLVSVVAAAALVVALWQPVTTVVASGAGARWERRGDTPETTLDPGPTGTPAEPTSQPTVLPTTVQAGGSTAAPSVRSTRTMTPTLTPTAAPSSPAPTPAPTPTPTPTPSPTASGGVP